MTIIVAEHAYKHHVWVWLVVIGFCSTSSAMRLLSCAHPGEIQAPQLLLGPVKWEGISSQVCSWRGCYTCLLTKHRNGTWFGRSHKTALYCFCGILCLCSASWHTHGCLSGDSTEQLSIQLIICILPLQSPWLLIFKQQLQSLTATSFPMLSPTS